MKLYDPKKKDIFVMQFGFSYPNDLFDKKKKLIRKYEVVVRVNGKRPQK